MSEFDPDRWPSYAAYLRDKNVQTRPQGWSHHTRDQVREYVSGKDGRRVKDTTDQLGNSVVQHGSDSQSVVIRNPVVVGEVDGRLIDVGSL